MIKIAVMGFGIVGEGVVEIVETRKNKIAKKIDNEIEVKYILDIRDFPDSPYKSKHIKDFNLILNDDEIDIVVECIGGAKIAYTYTKQLLQAGKTVVTSNKELVSKHSPELLDIARDKNVNYLFEASVGGGIPIIRPIAQCLAANDINEIQGILNGTTNYILTQMVRENKSFEVSLKEAQELGYAEADPTADIEGHDVCRKISILCSLSYGWQMDIEKIHTEGITKLSPADIHFAEIYGGVVKLIARARRRIEDGKINAMVSPAILPTTHYLAHIDDVYNGIFIKGDIVGDLTFSGRGAGKYPTTSAVVADIIDAAKHMSSRKWVHWTVPETDMSADYQDMPVKYMVRIKVKKDGEKIIRDYFGNVNFIYSKEYTNEIAFVTPHYATEKKFTEKYNGITASGLTVTSKLRIIED